jgi:hypothetical protein
MAALTMHSWGTKDWIPKTLEETVPALDSLLSKEDRQLIQESPTSEDVSHLIIRAHHNLGRYLQNAWGLWQDSELAQHFRVKHGISHPDDMTHAILAYYSRARIRTRFERLLDDDL